MDNKKIKLILYPVLYWMIFIIIPAIFIYNYRDTRGLQIIIELLFLYILFIAPFLYIIPYKLAKPRSKKAKSFFILLGLILPFIFIYLFIYIDYQKNFNPSF